jgi:hypothetical protein
MSDKTKPKTLKAILNQGGKVATKRARKREQKRLNQEMTTGATMNTSPYKLKKGKRVPK